MTITGWTLIAAFLVATVLLTPVAGNAMTRVMGASMGAVGRFFRPLEAGLYRLAGIDAAREQSWWGYALAMLVFKLVCFLVVYSFLRLQAHLPLNPLGLGSLTPDLAYNTAISFMTNTNWQSYAGETTMSYLSQMVALTVQNFTSAAAGIAIAFAVFRGFARGSAKTIGNFWVDLTRITLYVLVPGSVVLALFLVWQGVPQTFSNSIAVTTLEGAHQTIAVGPVASQEAIKMLGTNGGGFFNTNSAHPFENPTPLTNFIEMLAIFVIGGGPDLRFRAHGGRQAPGMGGVLRHGGAVRRGCGRDLLGRRARQPGIRGAWR
jgi:K+-transporting ATPase ATPase A chain